MDIIGRKRSTPISNFTQGPVEAWTVNGSNTELYFALNQVSFFKDFRNHIYFPSSSMFMCTFALHELLNSTDNFVYWMYISVCMSALLNINPQLHVTMKSNACVLTLNACLQCRISAKNIFPTCTVTTERVIVNLTSRCCSDSFNLIPAAR